MLIEPTATAIRKEADRELFPGFEEFSDEYVASSSNSHAARTGGAVHSFPAAVEVVADVQLCRFF